MHQVQENSGQLVCLLGQHKQLMNQAQSAGVVDVPISKKQFVKSLPSSGNVLANA